MKKLFFIFVLFIPFLSENIFAQAIDSSNIKRSPFYFSLKQYLCVSSISHKVLQNEGAKVHFNLSYGVGVNFFLQKNIAIEVGYMGYRFKRDWSGYGQHGDDEYDTTKLTYKYTGIPIDLKLKFLNRKSVSPYISFGVIPSWINFYRKSYKFVSIGYSSGGSGFEKIKMKKEILMFQASAGFWFNKNSIFNWGIEYSCVWSYQPQIYFNSVFSNTSSAWLSANGIMLSGNFNFTKTKKESVKIPE